MASVRACGPRGVGACLPRGGARGVSGCPFDGSVLFTSLRRRGEFQTVYRQGVKVTGRHLVVFALARDGERCRYGITATRRIGKAVVRNRARRRVRELFRRHGGVLADGGVDVVVNVRHSCSAAPWSDVEGDFVRCLSVARRRLSQPAS
jgi:ribonuclease P protein component